MFAAVVLTATPSAMLAPLFTEDTFTGEEMRSIMAELDQELEEQQAEIEGDSTIGQGGAPTASR